MTEPAVALTDFALSIECFLFAFLLSRQTVKERHLYVALFVCLGLAPLCGGLVHGFFLDETLLISRVLWRGTIVIIGAVAMCCWWVGALLTLRGVARQAVMFASGIGFLIYAPYVSLGTPDFSLAVLCYLPSTIFLFVALLLRYLRTKERFLLMGIEGLFLTFVAAAIQQARLSIDPDFLNYNALYHLVQGVALGLLFVAFQKLLRTPSPSV